MPVPFSADFHPLGWAVGPPAGPSTTPVENHFGFDESIGVGSAVFFSALVATKLGAVDAGAGLAGGTYYVDQL
jgi:hypothetical protein